MEERKDKLCFPRPGNKPHLVYNHHADHHHHRHHYYHHHHPYRHHHHQIIIITMTITWTPCVYPSTRSSGKELPLASKEFSVYNEGSFMSACSNLTMIMMMAMVMIKIFPYYEIFSILLPINKYKRLWPRPSDLAFRIGAWLTERLHLVDETWRFRPCQEQWCWSITIIVIVNIYFILVIAVSVKITLELVDKGCWKLPMQQNNHLSCVSSKILIIIVGFWMM